MFRNIKLLGVLVLALLLLSNCTKDNKTNDKATGEISFAVLDGNMDKSDIFDIECSDLVPTKARINLNGTFYYPELFELNGVLYTQSLKLGIGEYTINEFSLITDDNVVVKSTPMADSHYAQFLTDGYAIGELPPFTIAAFEKNEYSVEVLCYIETAYTGFGFEWFDITELTVRSQCFFGDFCIKDPAQYVGSLYDNNGVTIDEVAIFRIDLTIAGNTESYYNYVNGEYISPLCIEYADNDNAPDQYLFELYIYVTSGATWDYVKFYEWTVYDDQMIPAGTDGVVDFVLGNCVMDETDLLLPPWMNLPAGGFSLNLQHPGANSYWDMTVGGISSSLYDMQNGPYAGWCADEGTTINPGTQGCMNALSSLYPDSLPSYWLNATPTGGVDVPLTRKQAICASNWLWNQAMIPNGPYAGYTSDEMQDALWNLFNNNNVDGEAEIMSNAARQHLDFSPLPGGWAAIFFAPCEGEPDMTLQMTFFVVDP